MIVFLLIYEFGNCELGFFILKWKPNKCYHLLPSLLSKISHPSNNLTLFQLDSHSLLLYWFESAILGVLRWLNSHSFPDFLSQSIPTSVGSPKRIVPALGASGLNLEKKRQPWKYLLASLIT